MTDHLPTLVNATRYLPSLSLASLRSFQPRAYAHVQSVASALAGVDVVHISASRLKKHGRSFSIGGGGLSEILKDHVPLERSCGLKSTLYLGASEARFYATVRTIFDTLLEQRGVKLSASDFQRYLREGKKLGSLLATRLPRRHRRVVVVHDFEYLPLVDALPDDTVRILHWHVDFPGRRTEIVRLLEPYIRKYDRVIVSNAQVAERMRKVTPHVVVLSPSINPLGAKSVPQPARSAVATLTQLGIDAHAPLLTQIGRFSSQKNPLDAIQVYERVRRAVPNVQLVLAGIFNLPGRDTETTLKKARAYARVDDRIKIFSNPEELGPLQNDHFLNSLYTASDIVLNMSDKEGFGLVITEAMWKKRPVIARFSPGAALQITDRESGMLVASTAAAADRAIRILKDARLARRLGENAQRSVRERFLISRYLSEMLDLYAEALATRTA